MASNSKRDTLNRLAKVGPNASALSKDEPRKTPPLAEPIQLGEQAASPEDDKRSLLSVGEAAEKLGIDKARMRVVLSHGQVAHKLTRKRPNTALGHGALAASAGTESLNGRGVRVPAELLEELRLLLQTVPHSDAPAQAQAQSALPVIADDTAREAGHDDAAYMPSTVQPVEADTSADDEPEETAHPEGEPQPPAIDPPPVAAESSMPLSLAFERLLMEKEARIDDLKGEIQHLREVLEREQSSHARTQTLLSLQSPAPEPSPPSSGSDPAAEVSSRGPEHPQKAEPRKGIFAWFRRSA